MFYKLRRGIKNLIKWFPIIWNDRDFDWAFLAEMMEYKFRRMSCHFKNHGHLVTADRDAREMLICAELLKRLHEDDSTGVQYWQHDLRMSEWQAMLGKMIGRKFRNWWD